MNRTRHTRNRFGQALAMAFGGMIGAAVFLAGNCQAQQPLVTPWQTPSPGYCVNGLCMPPAQGSGQSLPMQAAPRQGIQVLVAPGGWTAPPPQGYTTVMPQQAAPMMPAQPHYGTWQPRMTSGYGQMNYGAGPGAMTGRLFQNGPAHRCRLLHRLIFGRRQ